MKDTKTLFFLSQSQILNVDLNKSITEFAKKLCPENIDNYSEIEDFVTEKFFYDSIITKHIDKLSNLNFPLFGSLKSWGYEGSIIDKYKKGKSETSKFCDDIRYRLSSTKEQLSDDDIKDAWNKMCKFDDISKIKFKNLLNHLEVNSNKTVVFVTSTNYMHQEYIAQQINSLLNDKQMQTLNKQVIFLNSCDYKTLNYMEIAKNFDEKIGKDSITGFVSMHRDINASELSQFYHERHNTNYLSDHNSISSKAASLSRPDSKQIKTTSKSDVASLIVNHSFEKELLK